MKDDTPSTTAAWVAALRGGLGLELPAGAQLCDDPYSREFSGNTLPPYVWNVLRGPLSRSLQRGLLRRIALGWVLYIQVRTRYLDDLVLRFVANGGTQIVLLGAGYDCRAVRFADALHKATVFEVDHPATQKRKREVLTRAQAPQERVRYISSDFVNQPISGVADVLASHGHQSHLPTLTLWEGVTMYLTEDTIRASLAAMHRYGGATGSMVGVTYFDRERVLKGKREGACGLRTMVARVGEPWKFGWDPHGLGAWMGDNHYELVENYAEAELAQRYLPAEFAQMVRTGGRHFALVRPV